MPTDSSPNPYDPDSPPARVVVAGGGVAALETVLALRDLAGERVSITLVAPDPGFTSSAMTVARVFARGHLRRVELAEIADVFVRDSVAEVDADAQCVRCTSGEVIDYDHLVLAVGANARPAWSRGITFGEDPAEEALHCMLHEIEQGYVTQVAFVVPGGTVWPLPLYELAVMTARQAWSMGMDRVRFTLVTPEERPLEVFGRAPSEAVGELLDGCGIEFIGTTYASVDRCDVQLDPAGRRLRGARVVSPPVLDGPDLPGVPADPSGFILADLHGRVPGLVGVYAAGDATAFPIKQGGLATQQADAVAESIAAAVGAPVTPEPFRPVLRAMLLTGGDTRYLQHAVAGGDGDGAIATHELWWPPAKLAGRYVTPYLSRPDDAEQIKSAQPATRPSRLLSGAGVARSG
ncbi:MAG: FAD-dependent oxidoreductase [Solirubrobacteraceae bacterium]